MKDFEGMMPTIQTADENFEWMMPASFVIEIKRTSTELNRKRMTIFFKRIALALQKDEDFIQRMA